MKEYFGESAYPEWDAYKEL